MAVQDTKATATVRMAPWTGHFTPNVGIVIHDDLGPNKFQLHTPDIASCTTTTGEIMALFSVYVPHDATSDERNLVLDALLRAVEACETKNVVIGGDFNETWSNFADVTLWAKFADLSVFLLFCQALQCESAMELLNAGISSPCFDGGYCAFEVEHDLHHDIRHILGIDDVSARHSARGSVLPEAVEVAAPKPRAKRGKAVAEEEVPEETVKAPASKVTKKSAAPVKEPVEEAIEEPKSRAKRAKKNPPQHGTG